MDAWNFEIVELLIAPSLYSHSTKPSDISGLDPFNQSFKSKRLISLMQTSFGPSLGPFSKHKCHSHSAV